MTYINHHTKFYLSTCEIHWAFFLCVFYYRLTVAAILNQPLKLFSENVQRLMITFYRILTSFVRWFIRHFANTTDYKQMHKHYNITHRCTEKEPCVSNFLFSLFLSVTQKTTYGFLAPSGLSEAPAFSWLQDGHARPSIQTGGAEVGPVNREIGATICFSLAPIHHFTEQVTV